jgi:aspartyl-tRNA(Asn)/glutamyl-tRNA(Gln) amidotransferase subunit A
MVRHAGTEELVHVHPTVRRYAEARPTADEVVEAHEARFRLIGVLAEAFTRFDLLLTPTTQVSAFAAEGPMPTRIAGQDVDHWSALGLTFPFNLSGHPAVSVPAGTVDGIPVGLQIVGRRHEDLLVLAAAARYERIRPWPGLAPMGR